MLIALLKRLTIALLFIAAVSVGACRELTNNNQPKLAKLQLQLSGSMRAATRVIMLRVTYRTATGIARDLLRDTLVVDDTTTEAPVTFDIAPCLRDAGREPTAARGGCRIYVELTLLNAAGATLDSQLSSPLDVSADGGTVTVPPLTLREVDAVRITSPPFVLSVGDTATLTGTVLDKTGAELAGRVVSWSTSAPSVATVSPTGVLRVLDAGFVTVRAVRDGRTDSLVLRTHVKPTNPRCAGRLTPIATLGPADTVIRVANSPYRMIVSLQGRPGTDLRIEAGVVLCVDPNVQFNPAGARARFIGTAAQHIVFAASDTALLLNGLTFSGAIVDSSRLEYVDIEYPGADPAPNAIVAGESHPVVLQDVRIRGGRPNIGVAYFGLRSGGRMTRVTIDTSSVYPGSPFQSAVFLNNKFVEIDSLVIRRSAGYGIFVTSASDSVPLPVTMRLRRIHITGVQFDGIGAITVAGPVSVDNIIITGARTPVAASAGFLASWRFSTNTQLTGNQRDTIDVNNGTLVDDTLVVGSGLPWRLNAQLSLFGRSQLRILGGARLIVAVTVPNRGVLNNGSNSSLVVQATASNPAIMTSASPTQRWGGIFLSGVTGVQSIRGLIMQRGEGNQFLGIIGTGSLTIDESRIEDVVGSGVIHSNTTGSVTVTRSSILDINGTFALSLFAGSVLLRQVTIANTGNISLRVVCTVPQTPVVLDSIQFLNVGSGISFEIGTGTFGQVAMRAINFDATLGRSVAWTPQATLDARNLWWGSNAPPPTVGAGSVLGNILFTPFATQRHLIPRLPP